MVQELLVELVVLAVEAAVLVLLAAQAVADVF
jgi:hypothetical protein